MHISGRLGFPNSSSVKNQLAMQETQETQVQSLGQEDTLEEENVSPTLIPSPHILARKIPWTEDPGVLQLWSLEELDTTEHTHARLGEAMVLSVRCIKCIST